MSTQIVGMAVYSIMKYVLYVLPLAKTFSTLRLERLEIFLSTRRKRAGVKNSRLFTSLHCTCVSLYYCRSNAFFYIFYFFFLLLHSHVSWLSATPFRPLFHLIILSCHFSPTLLSTILFFSLYAPHFYS